MVCVVLYVSGVKNASAPRCLPQHRICKTNRTEDGLGTMEGGAYAIQGLPSPPDYFISASRHWGISLFAGLVAGIVVGVKSCAVSAACSSAGTCVSTGMCSFRNVVPPTAEASYDGNVTSDALAAILRGICSPGDIQQRSMITGQTECIPFFPYPDALNAEI